MIILRMQIFGKTNYFAVLKASGSLPTDLRKHHLAVWSPFYKMIVNHDHFDDHANKHLQSFPFCAPQKIVLQSAKLYDKLMATKKNLSTFWLHLFKTRAL